MCRRDETCRLPAPEPGTKSVQYTLYKENVTVLGTKARGYKKLAHAHRVASALEGPLPVVLVSSQTPTQAGTLVSSVPSRHFLTGSHRSVPLHPGIQAEGYLMCQRQNSTSTAEKKVQKGD